MRKVNICYTPGFIIFVPSSFLWNISPEFEEYVPETVKEEEQSKAMDEPNNNVAGTSFWWSIISLNIQKD